LGGSQIFFAKAQKTKNKGKTSQKNPKPKTQNPKQKGSLAGAFKS
jgi:hypothetical protein